MIRLFEQHHVRKVQELDGCWDFCAGKTGKNYKLPVPGCWEQHPDLMNYRGQGTYTRKIHVREDGFLRFVWKGVSHTADVYFDGKLLAHHYNAFTPFESNTDWVTAGEHEVRVEVDNSFGEHSALHIPNDYYTYGGITRPVALEQLPEVYIERVHFTPECRGKAWSGQVEVWLENLSDNSQTVEVCAELTGVSMGQTVVMSAHEKQRVEWKQDFPEAMPWSPDSPELYLLEIVLQKDGRTIDDLVERVGFRQVTVEGNRILLNGEKIYLQGFNRHEDYAQFGCAIPFQLMVQDMDLMQDLGANAVRTCHYPNDERFLDLCDERGMLVWEENHARGLHLDQMKNPNFEQQCEDCIREMIENHYNHPAIVIWGILNECASDMQEARWMYKKQYEQIKEMDKSRPTTSATCRHFKDICLDLPDVVSYNLYSGWYQDLPVAERHDQEIDWIETTGGAGKPLIVSELGAGAIYGYRDRAHSKWSEERQVDILKDNLDTYLADDRISGLFIWQFADCRVTEDDGKWFDRRPRTHNNKGIVDEYRRPKLAYDTVKECLWRKREGK